MVLLQVSDCFILIMFPRPEYGTSIGYRANGCDYRSVDQATAVSKSKTKLHLQQLLVSLLPYGCQVRHGVARRSEGEDATLMSGEDLLTRFLGRGRGIQLPVDHPTTLLPPRKRVARAAQ